MGFLHPSGWNSEAAKRANLETTLRVWLETHIRYAVPGPAEGGIGLARKKKRKLELLI